MLSANELKSKNLINKILHSISDTAYSISQNRNLEYQFEYIKSPKLIFTLFGLTRIYIEKGHIRHAKFASFI